MSGFCFDEARITAVLKNGTEVSFKFLNEEHMEAALEFWQFALTNASIEKLA